MKFLCRTILPTGVVAVLGWLLFPLVKGAFPLIRHVSLFANFSDALLTRLCLLLILLVFVMPWWLSDFVDRHNYREETKRRLLGKIRLDDDTPWEK